MADGRLGPELEHPTPAHAAQLDADLGGRDLRFRRDSVDDAAPVHAGRVLFRTKHLIGLFITVCSEVQNLECTDRQNLSSCERFTVPSGMLLSMRPRMDPSKLHRVAMNGVQAVSLCRVLSSVALVAAGRHRRRRFVLRILFWPQLFFEEKSEALEHQNKL